MPFADNHINIPQSWNLFSYVRSNPARNIDPNGKDTITIVYGRGWEQPGDLKNGYVGNGFKNAALTKYKAMLAYAKAENSRRVAKGKSGKDLVYVEEPQLVSNKKEFDTFMHKKRDTGSIVQTDVYCHSWQGGLNFGGNAGEKDWKVRNYTIGDATSMKTVDFSSTAKINLNGCNTANTSANETMQQMFGVSMPLVPFLAAILPGKTVSGNACGSHFEGDSPTNTQLVPDDPDKKVTITNK